MPNSGDACVSIYRHKTPPMATNAYRWVFFDDVYITLATMCTAFTLISTHELLLEAGNTIRPFRLEVFCSRDISNFFRARVWEQTTYNLYPTFANIFEGEGLQNRILSCDEVNREVTSLVADTPEFITGKEWESEAAFVEHSLALLRSYHSHLMQNFLSKGGDE